MIRPVALLLGLLAAPALAQPCLQAPWRDSPCPNLMYQAVNGEEGARMLCVCQPDFAHLQKVPETAAGQTLRVKELERIAASYNLSDSELRQALRLAD
ncbi:hypothetical protein [Ferrimonas balearica]|uniref:hypothetical protein n=1 Tax=Ferrimonas balearica TaxID=44012 RepID=UPI001C9A2625|nr:hypothetical protein [Ferrimonas balearica]MBY5993616.1 hypothetical protein [Ferrimonas balearica]